MSKNKLIRNIEQKFLFECFIYFTHSTTQDNNRNFNCVFQDTFLKYFCNLYRNKYRILNTLFHIPDCTLHPLPIKSKLQFHEFAIILGIKYGAVSKNTASTFPSKAPDFGIHISPPHLQTTVGSRNHPEKQSTSTQLVNFTP